MVQRWLCILVRDSRVIGVWRRSFLCNIANFSVIACVQISIHIWTSCVTVSTVVKRRAQRRCRNKTHTSFISYLHAVDACIMHHASHDRLALFHAHGLFPCKHSEQGRNHCFFIKEYLQSQKEREIYIPPIGKLVRLEAKRRLQTTL